MKSYPIDTILPQLIEAVHSNPSVILHALLTNEGTSLTKTTVSLDVNVFAMLMIIGVSLAVIIVNYAFDAVTKTP